MTGLVRQDAAVTIQPTGVPQVAQFGMDKMMEAQNWKDLSSSAMTAFDLVKRDYDKDAIERAQVDAPALIKRDGTGLTMPVESFEPPGVTSQAYRDAYRDRGRSLYLASVQQDHENFLRQVATENPTDLGAAKSRMDERLRTVVAGLDPKVAPLVTLQLNAMNGQLQSRIGANIQAETAERANINAERAYQLVVLNASQLAKTPDKFDAETLALNQGLIRQNFDEANKQMILAGWGEAKRTDYWNKAKTRTEIARDVEFIRQNVMAYKSAEAGGQQVDLTQMQIDLLQHISTRRKTLGVDGDAYAAAAHQALGEATQREGLIVQRNQLQAADGIARKTAQSTADLIDAGGVSANNPAGLEALNVVKRRRLDMLTDPSLSAVQRLQGAAALDTVIAGGTSDLNTHVVGTVAHLATTALDPSTSPARSKAMYEDLKVLANDVQVMRQLPPGTRNLADRSVAAIAEKMAATDMTGTLDSVAAGFHDLGQMQEIGRKWKEKGWIGDPGTQPNARMSDSQWAVAQVAGQQAYDRRQFQKAEALAGATAAARGQVPTPSQAAALTEGMGGEWRPPGNASVDLKNPDHRSSANQRLAATMAIPPLMVEAIKATKRGGDPDGGTAAAQFVMDAQKTLQGKGWNETAAVAEIGSQIGNDNLAFLKNVDQYGYPEAVKMALRTQTSVSTTAGEGKAGVPDTVKTSIDGLLGDFAKAPSFLDSLWDGRSTPQRNEEAARQRFLGDSAPTMFGRKNFNSYTIEPGLRAEIEKHAGVIKLSDFRALEIANPGIDANKIVSMQALQAKRGDIEIAADPADPKRAIIQPKSAGTMLGEVASKAGGPGGKYDDGQVHAWSLGYHRAVEQQKRELGIPATIYDDVDLSTVTMGRKDNGDGTMSWLIVGQNRGSQTTTILQELAPDDPALSAFAGDVLQAVSADMVKHNAGKSVTAALGGSAAARWAGAAVGAADSLLTDTARGRNLEQRLAELSLVPGEHRIKGALDSFFGSESARDYRPIVSANPRDLIGGSVPGPPAEMKRLRKSIEDKMDPEVRQRIQSLELSHALRMIGVHDYEPVRGIDILNQSAALFADTPPPVRRSLRMPDAR